MKEEHAIEHKLNELDDKLSTLITRKEKEINSKIDKIETAIQSQLKEINVIMKGNASSLKLLQNTVDLLTTQVKEKLHLNDFNTHKAYINNKLEKIGQVLTDNDATIKNINAQIDTTNKKEDKLHELLNQCQQNINNTINKKLEEYLKVKEFNIQLEMIKSEKEYLDNKVTSLQNNINPYALLNFKANGALNKGTPDAFLKHLFDTFKADANAVIAKQDEKIAYIESLLNTFKKNLNMNLYTAAKKAVGQFKARGELLENASNKDTFNSFHSLISKKCDYSELQFIDDYKANKTDLEILHLSIREISDKMKYTLTLLNEFIKTMISNDNKPKAEIANKLSYIAHQVSVIAKQSESVGENVESMVGVGRDKYSIGIVVKSSKKSDTSRLHSSYLTKGCKRITTAHKKNSNTAIRRFCSSAMDHSKSSYRNTQKICIHKPRFSLLTKGEDTIIHHD